MHTYIYTHTHAYIYTHTYTYIPVYTKYIYLHLSYVLVFFYVHWNEVGEDFSFWWYWQDFCLRLKQDYLTTCTSLSPIRCGFVPGFVNYKKGALDSQLQVIKFTSCLPMVGGSLRVFRLPPPLKLFAMIFSWNIAESGIKHQKSNQIFS